MTWYAIRTAPQRERAVEAMLRVQGYVVFLPVETKVKRVGRGSRRSSRTVVYPMFVRYLFVRAPVPWLHLMAVNHVTGVVGFDGTPAPIEDHEIERIKNMSGNIPHRASVNPHRALRTGEVAEITAGPFAGQVVKIAGLHGNKAKIFVNLFGGVKEAEILLADLEAA